AQCSSSPSKPCRVSLLTPSYKRPGKAARRATKRLPTTGKTIDCEGEPHRRLPMPTRNELAAKSAPPATGRGSGDVEKQDLAASVGNGNGSSNPATETKSQQPSLTGLPFLLLFSSVILAVLQIALNATITSTVIPIITDEFHSADDVGWYASSFFVTTCAVSPLTGKLFRLFDAKATFIAFLAIYFLGSLLAGVARSSAMFIGARAVAGVGGSGILTGGMTLIAMSVPIAKRSLVNAVLMGMFATFQAVGPVIGGALTSSATWRWCFYINLPLGGVVMIFVGLFVKIPSLETPKRPIAGDNAAGAATSEPLTLYEKLVQIDLVGLLTFVLATALFLIGLQWGGTAYPWASGMVIGFMAGGLVCYVLLGFWFWHKGDLALIPTRFFRSRVLNLIAFTSIAQAGGTFTALYWYPIWFQAVKGADALRSGVMLLPLILAQLVFSIVSGGLVQKTGYYLPEVVAGNILIALGGGLTTTFVPSTGSGEWIGYQILVGAGRGLALQVANVPNEDASIASAYAMFAQFFGGALCNCVAKTIMTSSLGPALARYAPDVDPRLFAKLGITEAPKVVSEAQLPGVLLAYNGAIYLQLAAAGVALVTGFGVGWKNLNRVDKDRAKEQAGPTPAEMPDPTKELAKS
ncbi:major facilitator superfamily transporter, partial [Apiospora kogelbergensis]|uniref:major facilitator superfamily transporter n=1 Tax=Apiospora kogelbergensis TaxID=1337665 RepID=UPI00312CCB2F